MSAFELIPFPAETLPKINISGEIKRNDNRLSIYYELSGETDQILFPASSASPSRKDNLWKATCFEFFIAVRDKPEYWEFNMSPSGDWNVYAMDAYRQVNIREETAFPQLPFEFTLTKFNLSLELSADIIPIMQTKQNLQIGIAAIIQTKGRKESYWALVHPTPHADFHTRESFTLSL